MIKMGINPRCTALSASNDSPEAGDRVAGCEWVGHRTAVVEEAKPRIRKIAGQRRATEAYHLINFVPP